MKALTLTQPWATLVAMGEKRYETRSWRTRYVGPLAIHAGRNLGPVGGAEGLMELVKTEPFHEVLTRLAGDWEGAPEAVAGEPGRDQIVLSPELLESFGDLAPLRGRKLELPLGAVVAVCDLEQCTPAAAAEERVWLEASSSAPHELAFGDFSPGRYAWWLSNVRPLPEPVECSGSMGVWDLPADVGRAVYHQLLAVPG